MISPAKQKIIQIDITNACPHECSNCTRFVGHHKKPFFMTVDGFSKAVDSLSGFPGMIGVMGGEPTLHPEFAQIGKILASKVLEHPLSPARYQRHDDFAAYRNRSLSSISARRGLWSSLGAGYYRHFEQIQDTFGYQCINDHRHNGEHMALLMPYEDLGISRQEFLKYRDSCWLQREWSASITPKGAFFCEVAGALDMLFDGPGGWPVEPGWWQREPKDFGDQLKWCDLCSACLPVPRRPATDGIDDVTPRMAKELRGIGSKKPVNIVTDYQAGKYTTNKSCEPYIADNRQRVSGTNDTIKPKSITAVMVCVGYDDYLAITLPRTVAQCDKVVVVTEAKDAKTIELCRQHGAAVVISKRLHESKAVFAKGKAINEGIAAAGEADWLLVMDADVILPPSFKADIKAGVLNPGCLYYTRRWGPHSPARIPSLLKDLEKLDWLALRRLYSSPEVAQLTGRRGNATEAFPFGYFQLFHPSAKALLGRETIYPEKSQTAEHDDATFGLRVWPKEKVVALPAPQFDVIHLPHGRYQENWRGRQSPRLGSAECEKDLQPTEWVAMKDCTCRGRLFKAGETLTASPADAYDLPRHFVRRVDYASMRG